MSTRANSGVWAFRAGAKLDLMRDLASLIYEFEHEYYQWQHVPSEEKPVATLTDFANWLEGKAYEQLVPPQPKSKGKLSK